MFCFLVLASIAASGRGSEELVYRVLSFSWLPREPIRGQYPGQVMSLSQSEAGILDSVIFLADRGAPPANLDTKLRPRQEYFSED